MNIEKEAFRAGFLLVFTILLVGCASAVGEIGGLKFGNFSFTWLSTLAAVIFILLLFMFFFFLLVKDRDKFMASLKKYHDFEMKRQKEFLMEQKCAVEKKKCISSGKLNAEVKTKIENLKVRQKMRMMELKKLKELGDEAAMERKLNEWKNKGYNTLLLESRLNELTGKEMKKIMARWKKKGYILK